MFDSGIGVALKEPARTIFGPVWSNAQRALVKPVAPGGGAERGAFRDLFSQIEVGWVFVRPIMRYAQHRELQRGREADRVVGMNALEDDALYSLAVETAELFRDLALTMFEWLTDESSARDTESAASEMERFATHVLGLEMAARGSDHPLVDALSRLNREVPQWCEAMRAIVKRLGDLWDEDPELAMGEGRRAGAAESP